MNCEKVPETCPYLSSHDSVPFGVDEVGWLEASKRDKNKG